MSTFWIAMIVLFTMMVPTMMLANALEMKRVHPRSVAVTRIALLIGTAITMAAFFVVLTHLPTV